MQIPEDDLVKSAAKVSREILEGGDDLLPVIFISNSKTDEQVVVGMAFDDQESKELTIGTVKQAIKDMGADSCLSILESWTLPPGKAEEFMAGLKSGKWERVSQHPDAYDCVMFSFESRHGTWMSTVPIEVKNGKRTIGDPKMERADDMRGLLSNFIDTKLVFSNEH